MVTRWPPKLVFDNRSHRKLPIDLECKAQTDPKTGFFVKLHEREMQTAPKEGPIGVLFKDICASLHVLEKSKYVWGVYAANLSVSCMSVANLNVSGAYSIVGVWVCACVWVCCVCATTHVWCWVLCVCVVVLCDYSCVLLCLCCVWVFCVCVELETILAQCPLPLFPASLRLECRILY